MPAGGTSVRKIAMLYNNTNADIVSDDGVRVEGTYEKQSWSRMVAVKDEKK
jgi:hypothetical protein